MHNLNLQKSFKTLNQARLIFLFVYLFEKQHKEQFEKWIDVFDNLLKPFFFIADAQDK